MGPISFLTNIFEDTAYILKKPQMDAERLQSRVGSLALRIFGGLLMVCAVSSAITSLATVPVSPLTGAIGFAGALLLGAVAYDMIVMGDNIRRMDNAVDDAHMQLHTNILDLVSRIGSSAVDVARAAVYEAQYDIPYVFRGTILFDPLIRCLKV